MMGRRMWTRAGNGPERTLGMEAWHIWVIAAIVLFAVEVLTPDLIMGSLGIGSRGPRCTARGGRSPHFLGHTRLDSLESSSGA